MSVSFVRLKQTFGLTARAASRGRALLLPPLLFWAAHLPAAEPADTLWTARYVVTMDAQRRVLEDGAVAVRGERIVAVGARAELEQRFRGAAVVRRPEALLAPGLINTHTHAAMALFRGIADDRRLQEWLEQYIFPAEARHVSPEFVRWGTRLACLEMLLAGVTTFTDMYYFEEVVAEVAREAGMRGVLGETIIGFPAPDAKTPRDALAYTERFLRRFAHDPLVRAAVAPHALYTNSDADLKASRALANRHGAPLLIHLAETRREVDETRVKRGKSPVRVLDELGVFQGRTVAAHVVWADDADQELLARRGVGIAHCPSSNMKLASGAAPVAAMLRRGLAVGLGTDGPAGSNNDFNLLEEIDLAAKLQKVTSGDPRVLPAPEAFAMATILGARALGLDREIGSLEPGKRADVIAIRLDQPHAVPLYDVYSALVSALKGSDIQDVMVNGRRVVADRKPLTLDLLAIRRKADEYAARVRATLPPTPPAAKPAR